MHCANVARPIVKGAVDREARLFREDLRLRTHPRSTLGRRSLT